MGFRVRLAGPKDTTYFHLAANNFPRRSRLGDERGNCARKSVEGLH